MSGISRRDLLSSGLALSASSLVARSAWARTAALLADTSGSGADTSAVAPREQLLFDFGWKFQFGNGIDPAKDLGFRQESRKSSPRPATSSLRKAGLRRFEMARTESAARLGVELPFVWDDTLASHGFKPLGRRYPETSVGWYRREFDIPASDAGRRIAVEFDGAFRDALVFVNGCFSAATTAATLPSDTTSPIFSPSAPRTASSPAWTASFGDGWFYEGAGIYRHVWLTKTDALHLGRWESYVRAVAERRFRFAGTGEPSSQNDGKQA